MTRQSLSQATSLVARSLRSSSSSSSLRMTHLAPQRAPSAVTPRAIVLTSTWTKTPTTPAAARFFLSATSSRSKGILPDSDDPSPPNVQESTVKAVPAELSDSEYHDLADEYLSVILDRLEEVAEKNDQVDFEYSAGVLNVSFPGIGTYVINKQPPNKQIWLSSPVSGPKRYDYVVYGEGQAQKEDTAVGDWVYLRDGSTMNDLFIKELDIDLVLPLPQ